MNFQGKCFLCYILLTDQISLPDCPCFLRYCTAWKKSVFGVFLVCIFRIQTEYWILRISPYSVRRRKNTDQKNSEYEHTATVCLPGCDVTNLETKLIFLIEPFFQMTKKSKELLRWNKNYFSSFLKGFQVP